MAGASAWMVCVPFDIVKSRLQAGSLSAPIVGAAAASPLVPATFASTVRALYGAGGIAAFYQGASAAVLRAFPANGALFLG